MSQTITQVNNTFTSTKQDLTQIFKSLDNLVEEISLTLNHEGLACRTMDPSHVSLIDISMISNDFEKYNIKEQLTIALNVKDFLRILKELDNGQIDLTIKKDTIELNQNGFNCSINRLESNDFDCPLPKISWDNEIQFNGISNSEIVKIFKKIAAISDYVTLAANENLIKFSGSGDGGQSSISLDKSKLLIFSKDDSESTYSLEYITPFLKSLTKNTKIKMEFSSTKPLRIATNIGAQSRIHFYLAPRVEN